MLINLLVLLTICISKPLTADIYDFLKKIQEKPTIPKMKNIDYIYMINLDQRPEKYQLCIDQLQPYGITPYRFSAINGWELTSATIDQLGVKYESTQSNDHWGTYYPLNSNEMAQFERLHVVGRTYFCHVMPKGSIGIVLSHLSILKDAYESGYETIWVMEDDIEVIRNPHLLSQYIEDLDALVGKNGWDILFTDQDTKGQDGHYVICNSYAWRPNFTPDNPYKFAERTDLNKTFRKIGARYGAYSMIIRRSGIIKLLDFFKHYQIFLPYDMEYTLPQNMRFICLKEDIVSTQPQGLTDNAHPNYKKKAFKD